MNTTHNNQAGVISIFTVMFFMIFVSIITVGFVKIIGDEQRQSTNNDLSASALAAAQSGVEEGKRVLLFCRATTNPAEKSACATVLNDTSCNALSGNTTLTAALDISVDAAGGIVSERDDYQQRWTCLTINPVTDDVDDVLIGEGESELIPLTGVGGFDTLQLSWHATASDRDGTPGGYPAGTNKVSLPEWNNSQYPAAIRIELISHPATGVDLTTLDKPSSPNPTRTLVLFPSSVGAIPTTYGVAAQDPRTDDPNARITPASALPVACNPVTSLPTYACTVNLSLATMPSSAPGSNQYYARVSAIYARTRVNLKLLNGGSPVNFNNVQPVVDVTGKTNDVFRRVKARVMFDTAYYMPNYAIESGERICKNMLVADDAASSNDACNP